MRTDANSRVSLAALCIAIAVVSLAVGNWIGNCRAEQSHSRSRVTAEAAIDEPTQFVPAFPDVYFVGDRRALLRDEVAYLRRKVRALRQVFGEAHCALKGIGPTGGFCLKHPVSKGPASTPTSGTWCDETLCAALGRMLAGQSVADLGAGLGQYGKCLRPVVRQYSAYDGSEGVEAVTNGSVHFMDLSEPTWLGKSFDWVVSLEVGEHIAAKLEEVFLQNVLRHAERGVVLSWALPGQGGHFHVNEQPNAYILGRVAQLSEGRFVHNTTASAALRKASTFNHFQNALMVFNRV